YTKGFAYMRFAMFDSSLFWFNKSIASNPSADWVINARGTLLFNFKRYSEALSDFTRAIELNPLGEYFYNRSMCYFTLSNVPKAKSDALIAIQKKFNVPATYKNTLQLDK
ncbi:MAG TPA: hypothetical protein VFO37_07020, partial [Chitinophagaceae bacterium]|nr:hypothetical protein [Chitinophagaceae bacterium]